MAKCPHCEKPVTLEKGNPNEVDRENVGLGIFGKESMYSCPHCEKVLGFSNSIRM